MNDNCCFPRDSVIVVQDGKLKLIQDIEDGDIILQFDVANRWQLYGKTDGVRTWQRDNLVTLVFEGGGTLVTTNDHPFLCREYQWKSVNPFNTLQAYGVEADILKVGDELLTAEATWARIDSISIEYGDFTTYSLIGCDYHNFFVGNGGVNVCAHNRGGDTPATTKIYHPAIPAAITKSVISITWTDGITSGTLLSEQGFNGWADHKTTPLLSAPGTFDNVKLDTLTITLTLTSQAALYLAAPSDAKAAVYNVQIVRPS